MIVEDEDCRRELFQQILANLGEVITGINGRDGLEWFRLGKELDPNLGRHFILCTGNATSDVQLLGQNEGMQLLEKPVSLTQLRFAVTERVRSPGKVVAAG